MLWGFFSHNCCHFFVIICLTFGEVSIRYLLLNTILRAALANESTLLFPWIPIWLGIQQNITFTYLGSSVSSIETDINTWLAKAWTAINRLSVIRKSDPTDKIKCSFFPAVVVLILLYGCTTWTLTKRMEKKLDANYTRMRRANNEQVLEVAPHKAAAVRPPTTHYETYQN